MHVGVLDFFCGSGGASWGFANAEVEKVKVSLISGVDVDPHCCATYRRMLGAPAEQLDIRSLLEKPKLLRTLRSKWSLASYDKVVAIGCAPCQGFAAHRKAVRGPDERRSLFVDFCRLARELRPDALFIENVPDIFSKRHWPHYVEGRRVLEQSGFVVHSRIYNFAGFGLPQERFRAVILALRHGFRMPHVTLEPASYRTVRDAIGPLPPLGAGEGSSTDAMHLVSRHRPATVAILSKVPKDGGNRPVGVGPSCLDRARQAHGGYTDVYGRLAWDRPAVTITARCRTPSCGRFAHPEQDRGLSIREAACLQGFPADYVFEGPFDDRYKQIGNAVPPLVAKTLAQHLLATLRRGRFRGHNETDPDDSSRDITAPVGPGFAVTINGIKKRRGPREQVHQ